MQRMFVAALLGVALLAGCLGNDRTGGGEPIDIVDGSVGQPGALYQPNGGRLAVPANALFAGPALYPDPQNAPHPAFNWPTLANPALGQLPNKWWAVADAAPLPNTISDLELVVQTPGVPAGAGIAIFGSLVVVPGYGEKTSVVDISDPTNPVVLSQFMNQSTVSSHRGAAFIAYPDGHLSVVISTGGGIDHWDLTDPTSPQPLPILMDANGEPVRSHKVGVIPGTPIVVNAASGGGAAMDPDTSPAITKMWDLSDRNAPKALPDFANGYSCHHVYFWNSAEQAKARGVCAGIQYTQLWDTTDPYNPSVIESIPFGSGGTPLEVADRSVQPPLSISHYAGLNIDGTILMMGDESGGGGTPPGCTVRADVPGVGAVSVPIGAVWFYDVSVETEPQYLGHYSASQLDKFAGGAPDDPATAGSRSCTAHHGRIIPVPGRDVLAMSWYASGVVVVDFTGIRNEGFGLPMTVAQFVDDSDTWETWYYNGYLFTGDLARGMDVLKLV